MSQEQINKILQKMEDMHLSHTEDHNKVMTEITNLKTAVTPVIEIYTDLNGTKKIMKYVVYVSTLVLGIILSIKNLKN